MRVPLVDLAAQERAVAGETLEAVGAVVREGRFVLGARVEAFERWLAGAVGARHAVGVASGTDAIELTLRALGIGPGDGVVTPAFSFIAAAEAIAWTGARPVFCDIDPATMTASARTVADAIDHARREGIRVRALVPVHLFGLCAPVDELSEVARREGLALVEDSAQALGAADDAGLPPAARADAGCFSFFPTKNLGAWGDAGAVVTSDDRIAANVRRLRAHGAVAPYVHAELGRNSRLDALQAAVLLVKAPHLPAWQDARARIASRYAESFSRLPLVLPYRPRAPAAHAWHAFVVRLARHRDALAAWLAARGVETRVYYPVPMHAQPCFAALGSPELPHAEQACRTAIALPIFPGMTAEQVEWVVEQVSLFFERT